MKSVYVRSVAVVALLVFGVGLAQGGPGMMGPAGGSGWNQQHVPGYGTWGGPGMGAYGRGWGHGTGYGMDRGMGYGMGPGMAYGGGYGMGYGMGPGLRSGMGFGSMTMGGAMMGGTMMGTGPLPAGATPLPMSEIEARLQAVLPSFPAGATIEDVMPFTNNVYAQVLDGQGKGLAEVLVDRYTGQVVPEPGPNMMWALAGPMGGRWGAGSMMGGYGPGSMMGDGSQAAVSPRYDQQQAQELATEFLSQYAPGTKVLQGQAFDGYYTYDFGDATVQGMLSVNAFTGAVWPHTWHGAYLGTGH